MIAILNSLPVILAVGYLIYFLHYCWREGEEITLGGAIRELRIRAKLFEEDLEEL